MFIPNNLIILTFALTLPFFVATAQDGPVPAEGGTTLKNDVPFQGPRSFSERKGPSHGMMGERGSQHQEARGLIFMRMLSRPEVVKELGLPDETAVKLGKGLEKIEEEEKVLLKKREELKKTQAEMMAALMSDRTRTGDDIRKNAAEIEAVQGKLFGLNIDRMLIVRDNLTDGQIKQASELVKKRFESRRNEMMQRRRREGVRPEEGRPNRDLRGKGDDHDQRGAPMRGRRGEGSFGRSSDVKLPPPAPSETSATQPSAGTPPAEPPDEAR
jgi:hypothetical protein